MAENNPHDLKRDFLYPVACGGLGLWLGQVSTVNPWIGLGGLVFFLCVLAWQLIRRFNEKDGKTKNQKYLSGLMISIIAIGLISVAAIAQQPWSGLDEDKIQVYMTHADLYEYRKADGDDQYRQITSTIGLLGQLLDTAKSEPILVNLKKWNYEPAYFAFGVANLNSTVALDDVYLHLYLKKDPPLEVMVQQIENRPPWQIQETNKHYFYKWPSVISWHHSNLGLFVKFNSPGEYVFTFKIVAKAGNRKIEIERPVKLTVF